MCEPLSPGPPRSPASKCICPQRAPTDRLRAARSRPVPGTVRVPRRRSWCPRDDAVDLQIRLQDQRPHHLLVANDKQLEEMLGLESVGVPQLSLQPPTGDRWVELQFLAQ